MQLCSHIDSTGPNKLIVTCDDGVYHLAREIKLVHAPGYSQGLGTLHGHFSYDENYLELFGQVPEGT